MTKLVEPFVKVSVLYAHFCKMQSVDGRLLTPLIANS